MCLKFKAIKDPEKSSFEIEVYYIFINYPYQEKLKIH